MMNLKLFLIMISSLPVFANGYSQNITLNVRNAKIEKVFLEIHEQTGYQFFYDDATFSKSARITVKLRDVPLEEALDKCFARFQVDFAIMDKTIFVNAKKNNKSLSLPLKPLDEGKTVTGRVISEETGDPQVGVAITIKETFKGTSTDVNGYFSIDGVKNSDVLVFSAINLETVEVPVGNQAVINVSMKQKLSILDEIQIVGYQTTTRRLKTSSVSSVKTSDIQLQPVTNPIQALQGRVSGLSITSTGGAIGSGQDILIRGVSTLTSGSQPLIIIDGSIVPNSGLSHLNNNGNYMFTAGSSPLNSINPNDIESIEVLKDADATAIYGSRGTNGVILINTKKAKIGTTRFTIDANTGINQAAVKYSRMNTQQYLEMRTDAFAMGNYNPTTLVAINPITPTAATAPDLLEWDQNQYTDWVDFEFGNPAKLYNLQGNLTGGTKNLSFYVSGGYSKNEDVTIGDPFQERISSMVNLEHRSSNNKFNLKVSNSFARDLIKPSRGSVHNFPLHALPPNMPLYEDDGSPWWPSPSITQNSLLTNPFAGTFMDIRSTTYSYIGNAEASYRLLNNLTVKTLFGYSFQENNNYTNRTSRTINPKVPGSLIPQRFENDVNFQSINIEPQLTYFLKLGKSKIDALAGMTFFDRSTQSYSIGLEGFDSDLLINSWAAGQNVVQRASTAFSYRFNSLFGRLGYNYDLKYLINLTFRRDGSSRFGPENKWANFGSVGIGWIFSNESFIRDFMPWLSYGKLRSSYGTTGNDNISDFRYTSLFTSSNILYGTGIGLAPSYIANPFFQWENTTKLDAAIELGFMSDRFLFNVNWFRNISTDLLENQNIPSTTGFSSYLGNFPGVIENKGWEFELTSNNFPLTSAFKWRTSFNVSLLKNTLLEYPGLEDSPNASSLEIGRPIRPTGIPATLGRTYVFTGVNPETGLPEFEDVNGDGVISTSGSADKKFVGSSIPRTYGGLNNTLSYKGFSLDFFIQFSQQMATNHLYLATPPGQMFNPIADIYGNYWKQPGDQSKYPRLFSGVGANTTTSLLTSVYYQSTATIDDVIYARLKTVSLSYSLPSKWLNKAKLAGATLYVRGQNVYTWVSKELFKDPEVFLQKGSVPMTVISGFNFTF